MKLNHLNSSNVCEQTGLSIKWSIPASDLAFSPSCHTLTTSFLLQIYSAPLNQAIDYL